MVIVRAIPGRRELSGSCPSHPSDALSRRYGLNMQVACHTATEEKILLHNCHRSADCVEGLIVAGGLI
jgi:hypothetical protein